MTFQITMSTSLNHSYHYNKSNSYSHSVLSKRDNYVSVALIIITTAFLAAGVLLDFIISSSAHMCIAG